MRGHVLGVWNRLLMVAVTLYALAFAATGYLFPVFCGAASCYLIMGEVAPWVIARRARAGRE